jgi:hypothetical protein
MVTWRNRPIESLSQSELRLALQDALSEIAWTRAAPTSASFFHGLLVSFAAGALVAAAAVFAIGLIT